MENVNPQIGFKTTVIILDWDDTLLPSSWVTQCGHRLDEPLMLDEGTKQELKRLENSVSMLLTRLVAQGNIVIITNAETGWVELSCSKFMPQVLGQVNKLRVVSARSSYERYYPNSPLRWKYAAFTNELNQYYRDIGLEECRNVISVGDSLHEKEAIHWVTSSMKNVLTKTIKFIDRPTISQLQSQIDIVNGDFDQIIQEKINKDYVLLVDPPVHGEDNLV